MEHQDREITGVLLLNLGGPDSLQAVRPFLYNLFSDRDIIRLGPLFLQKPLAWLIAKFRSKKTEEMYSQIGGKSPILDITTAQADALEKALNKAGNGEKSNAEKCHFTGPETHKGTSARFKVYIGMRYWHPFIKDTVQQIIDDGIKQLVVLSLYPHYSKATTGSAMDEFRRAIKKFKIQDSKFKIHYIEQWFDFPPYIDALADVIAEAMDEPNGENSELLYSAHSLPQSFIDEGDPYLDHIQATIESVNKRLTEPPYNVPSFKWHLSFQSKTGPVRWLEPTTEETIVNLSEKGCRNLLVVPVSFVSDHIETLYEIDIMYRELAEKHGMKLKRCRALNISERFIDALRDLVISKIK